MTDCTGITRAGNPCTVRAIIDTDPPRCRHHVDQPDAYDEAINWTPDHWTDFLAAFRTTGNVTAAAREVGMSRSAVYDWIGQNDEAARQLAHAREEAADQLERVALQRATVGIEEPVYYQGQVVGTIRRPSDQLLMFLLRATRPEKFRERSGDVNVAVDQSDNRTVEVTIGGGTDEYVAGLRALRERAIDTTTNNRGPLP